MKNNFKIQIEDDMEKSKFKKSLISVYECLYEMKRELLINIKYPFKIMSEFETIEYIKKIIVP